MPEGRSCRQRMLQGSETTRRLIDRWEPKPAGTVNYEDAFRARRENSKQAAPRLGEFQLKNYGRIHK